MTFVTLSFVRLACGEVYGRWVLLSFVRFGFPTFGHAAVSFSVGRFLSFGLLDGLLLLSAPYAVSQLITVESRQSRRHVAWREQALMVARIGAVSVGCGSVRRRGMSM